MNNSKKHIKHINAKSSYLLGTWLEWHKRKTVIVKYLGSCTIVLKRNNKGYPTVICEKE